MALSMSRERFLEQKISMLDKRLTLVERFVELRFKDSFQTILTPDPEDTTTAKGGQNQEGLEFEDIFILNPDDSTTSHDELNQLPKGKGGPGTRKKIMAVKRLPAQARKRLKSNLSEVPSEECLKHTDTELLREDNIKESELQARSEGAGKDNFQMEPPLKDKEFHGMDESDSNHDAEDGIMDMESESSYPVVEQKVNMVAGMYEDGSYVEFWDDEPQTDRMEADVTSKRTLRSSTKGKNKASASGSEAVTSGDIWKAIDTETTRRGNNSNKRRSQSGKPCGTKFERRSTRKNQESHFTEESAILKKRVYAPALCSSLPPIARADPTRRECPMCHMHIKNELFEAHMDSHVKERHLKCPFCEKRYFNQSMLRKHRMIHQPEKYGKKCRICEKLFFQGDKKLAHERFCVKRALEKKDFVDSEIIQDLKNRSRDWTPEEEPVTYTDPLELKECPHCHKMFKANFYQRHLKMHTQTKHWACNLCDKEYFHKHDLVRHFVKEHKDTIKSTKSSRLTAKREENIMALQSVEIIQPEPEAPKNISEPVLKDVGKLETNPFNDDGATVTLLSEDIIVVSSDVEVSQLEEQSHSIILVEEELETPPNPNQ